MGVLDQCVTRLEYQGKVFVSLDDILCLASCEAERHLICGDTDAATAMQQFRDACQMILDSGTRC